MVKQTSWYSTSKITVFLIILEALKAGVSDILYSDQNCFDTDYCIETRCMTNCKSCSSKAICLTCDHGYFLYYSPKGTVECVPCPYQDDWIDAMSNPDIQLKCAQCIQNPHTWDLTLFCQKTYKLDGITNEYLQEIQLDLNLPEVYSIIEDKTIVTPNKSKFVVQKIYGCLKPLNVEGANQDEPLYDGEGNLIIRGEESPCFDCLDGFYLDPYNSGQCAKCDDGCKQCEFNSETNRVECKECLQEYALRFDRVCVKCDDISNGGIENCKECYFGDEYTNYSDNMFLLPIDMADPSEVPLYLLRCTSCFPSLNTGVWHRIPNLKLTSCIDCGKQPSDNTDSLCYNCMFVYVFDLFKENKYGEIFSHTASLYVVEDTELVNFVQYCKDCQSTTGVSYTVANTLIQCIPCPIKCEYCYTKVGSNFIYDNFPVLDKTLITDPGTALCSVCSRGMNLQADGTCQPFAGTTIENCATYKEDSCAFCLNGYLLENNQCTTPCSNLFQDVYCHSCQLQEEVYICTSCSYGYIPTPLGCVRCGDGCSSCSEKGQLIDFTKAYVSDRTSIGISFTNSGLMNYNNQFKLGDNPVCRNCDDGKGFINIATGQCEACGNFCDVNIGCFTQAVGTGGKQCLQCQSLQTSSGNYYFLDDRNCGVCPKYCRSCIHRNPVESYMINPAFDLFGKFAIYSEKCLVCEEDTTDINYVYNSLYNRCTKCFQGDESCKRSIKLSATLMCGTNDNGIDSDDFISLKQVMKQKGLIKPLRFTTLEKANLFAEFNDNLVDDIEMTLNLEKNSRCVFDYMVQFTSLFPKNIFAISQLSLKIQTAGNPSASERATLVLQQNLTIQYYDTISFIDVNIEGDVGLQNADRFCITTLEPLWPIQFQLRNSIWGSNIEGLSVQNRNKPVGSAYFYFQLTDLTQLVVENLEIRDMVYVEGSPLNLLYNPLNLQTLVYKVDLSVKNMQLTRVWGQSMKILVLQIINSILKVDGLEIRGCRFEQSILFSDEPSNLIQTSRPKADIFFKTVTISDSQFDTSKLTQFSNILQFVGDLFSFQGLNQLFNCSSFMESNTFVFTLLKLQPGSVIKNSTLFGTPFASLALHTAQSQIMKFKDFALQEIMCQNNLNCFMDIQTPAQQGQNLISLVLQDISVETFNFQYDPPLVVTPDIDIYATQLRIFSFTKVNDVSIQRLKIKENKEASIIFCDDIFSFSMLDSSFEYTNFTDINEVPAKFHDYCMRIERLRTSVLFLRVNVTNLAAINKALIHILPVGVLGFLTPVTIKFDQCLFNGNFLQARNENAATAIIKIFANEITSVTTVTNSVFSNNFFLKNTTDNLLYESSSGIFVQNLSGQLIINRTTFLNNTSLYGKNNIYAYVQSIAISNCQFNNSNLRIPLIRLIGVSRGGYNYIPLQTKGGHFYAQSQSLILSSSVMDTSLSAIGGSIYFYSLAAGFARILGCQIYNSRTTLNESMVSSGGFMYVFAQESNLDLIIADTLINGATSRYQGGVIFIDSARGIYNISLSNVNFFNTYAMQGALIYTSFSGGATINVQYSIFENNYSKTVEFMNSVLVYERPELLKAEFLSNPSYFYCYNSDSILMRGNSFTNIFFYKVFSVIKAMQFNDTSSFYGNFLNFNQPVFFFSDCDIIQFASVLFQNSKSLNQTSLEKDNNLLSKTSIFGLYPKGFFEITQSAVSFSSVDVDNIECVQCLNSVLYLIDSPFLGQNCYFGNNKAYEGGVFTFFKTPPMVRAERRFNSEEDNLTLFVGNISLHNQTTQHYLKNPEDMESEEKELFVSFGSKMADYFHQQSKNFSTFGISHLSRRLLDGRFLQQTENLSMEVTIQLVNTQFFRNRAEYRSGAISAFNHRILFQNCTFIYNSAYRQAGAMYLWSAEVQYNNVSFGFNQAEFAGSIRYINTTVSNSSTATFQNNLAYLQYNDNIDFCMYGEFQVGDVCQQCADGMINLEPRNAASCVACPSDQATCQRGYQLNLIKGFWRKHNLTDQIEPCSGLPESCLGGSSQFTCYQGHIGALCESCDNYGQYWDQRWANTAPLQCGVCNDGQYAIWMIIIITIYSMVMTGLKILAGFEAESMFMNNFFLFSKGWGPLDIQSIFIKIVTNWQQILLCVTSFGVSLPQAASDSTKQTGNPSGEMTNNLDCYLVLITETIPIVIFRIFFVVGTPVIIFLVLLIWMIIQIQREAQKGQPFDFNPIFTCLIFMFLYFQPGIFEELVSVLACRQITTDLYISANVAYECYSSEHIIYLAAFIGPLLAIVMVIVPALFGFIMHKNSNNLNHALFFIRWNTLYLEYANHAFYWELVKISLKMFIYLFLAVFDSEIKTKGLLIILFMFFYQMLVVRVKPYKNRMLNQFEILSNEVIIISLISGLCISQNPFVWMQIILYIVLYGINLIFLLLCLKGIFSKQIRDNQQLFDLVRAQIYNLNPQFMARIGLSPVTSQRREYIIDYWVTAVYFWRIRQRLHKGTSLYHAGAEFRACLDQEAEEIKAEQDKEIAIIKQQFRQSDSYEQVDPQIIEKELAKLKKKKADEDAKIQKEKEQKGQIVPTESELKLKQIEQWATEVGLKEIKYNLELEREDEIRLQKINLELTEGHQNSSNQVDKECQTIAKFKIVDRKQGQQNQNITSLNTSVNQSRIALPSAKTPEQLIENSETYEPQPKSPTNLSSHTDENVKFIKHTITQTDHKNTYDLQSKVFYQEKLNFTVPKSGDIDVPMESQDENGKQYNQQEESNF